MQRKLSDIIVLPLKTIMSTNNKNIFKLSYPIRVALFIFVDFCGALWIKTQYDIFVNIYTRTNRISDF
jgi:hypothetical protein